MRIVADLAYPLPVTVICELLGVPREDEARFQAWAAALARGLDPAQGMSEEEIQQAMQAAMQMLGYMGELIAARQAEPKDDLLSGLVAGGDPAKRMSPPDLLCTTALLLLASGSRDPARFPDSDRFVPERSDNAHLGFGGGIHYCVGAPLARMEAHVALSALARRLVDPRLLADPPPYRENASLRGPARLLVGFERLAD